MKAACKPGSLLARRENPAPFSESYCGFSELILCIWNHAVYFEHFRAETVYVELAFIVYDYLLGIAILVSLQM